MKNIHTLRERATNKLYRKVMREMLKQEYCVFKVGDKVTFNLEYIRNHPSWEHMNPIRKQFIEDHSIQVFTLAYDEHHIDSIDLFVFVEDTSLEKWLWHRSELMKVQYDG